MAAPTAAAAPPASASVYPVMLGIDVLEATGFKPLLGKRVGLLTHPAGVNRRGVSTVDVLRQAPQVNLVALFGPEHGIYGDEKANVPVDDRIDPRTGLPVFSLYGKYRTPTAKMLSGLDVLVVDLQDIGTRSYTYVSCMRLAMTACFEAGVQFIVLDRPNPLGGLKVDGPPLDAKWKSYVGAFRVPYVHGLTIGELARMAKHAPGVLDVDAATLAAGDLLVVPMRGWTRSMRWPETGLNWVPTSPMIPDFAAVVGYPMVGLGAELNKFSHGLGPNIYPFRGIAHGGTRIDELESLLRALHVPGVGIQRVQVNDRAGRPTEGLYLQVTDWSQWNPTEMNFHLMRLACALEKPNPYVATPRSRAELFIKHLGSEAFFDAIARDGDRVDLDAWLATWKQQAAIYQKQSQRFWLYQ
ncbi:DUF1343 domain-containing protein [Synoicihabitans lomoniglobus]|uniref:DUF1343 domain-containing protein n=1 Tax=Synoicihabitans lomoniglobus TaxID=2909285 RepID=A0AAE9ZW60_9BACT|nr:DUF1343 domain-containing protein [Opitutaceae bacterium LMO-M01]WED63608.1 DUF1343 domain-containing protein [Opitutaceae bacterium LMO-M01]